MGKVQGKEALVREGVITGQIFDGDRVADERLGEPALFQVAHDAVDALFIHVCLS